jgi:site-specific DNA-methyltransferase (adenine-specific)
VVAGNGTLEAAKNLGWTEIAISRTPVGWSWEQIRAFALADNRTAELAEWDDKVLADQLLELDANGWELEELGFENLEPPAGQDNDDEPLSFDDAPTRSKLGDLWQIGKHKILCADSTDVKQIQRLMSDKKADCIFTDPPYNVASHSKNIAATASKAHSDLKNSEWDKNWSFSETSKILELVRNKDCTIYVCTSHVLAPEIWQWMDKDAQHVSYVVWHKPNPMPSLMKRHWTWSTELVCYATYGKHTFNFPEFGHASNVWSINKKSDGTHPTQKPVDLVKHALQHSSKKNDLIVDLFAGSGTTLVAADQLERICYAVEFDPRYVDVILSRLEKQTGLEAQLLED